MRSRCTCGFASTRGYATEVPRPDKRTAWLEGDGLRYKRPLLGKTNWLSKTPFPMNPSFSPKAPLSNSFKQELYSHVKNGIANARPGTSETVILRAISQKYAIAMDRLQAIVRLKVEEEAWVKKGNALQSQFSAGMESALGVSNKSREGFEKASAVKLEPASKHQVYEFVDEETGDAPVLPKLTSDKETRLKHKADQAAVEASDPQQKLYKNKRRPNRPAILIKDIQSSSSKS